MKKLLFLTALAACTLVACKKEQKPDSFKTKEVLEYETAWQEVMGDVDPEQTWIGAERVSLEIKNVGPSLISIYTLGEAERVLLKREYMNSDATLEFDIPTGLQSGVAICRQSEDGIDYLSVSRASLLAGGAQAVFSKMETKASPITDANKAALTGATCINPLTGENARIYGYTTFPAWIWYDMNAAIPENKSAVASNQITNFELQSNGLFYVSTIYGATGVNSAEIGYYYYPQGDPENKTFIPLVNALAYDYYYDNQTCTEADALPKVLWLDKETWKWNPANFCYYDKISGMASGSFKTRQGDDQYNALSVQETYGNIDPSLSRIGMVKGLTFQVNAPKGNMVGFYCKRDGHTNYTTTDLNGGRRRAAIKVYDGFRFIGLEDGNSDGGNEPDCNDIALVMVPGNDGTLPGLLLPYIKDEDQDKYYNGDGTFTEEPKYDTATDGEDPLYEELASKKQVWTVAFEDMSSKGDFDFNDVVLVIDTDKDNGGKGSTRIADVYLCATGGTISSVLYYKDEKIGEVHELLGSVENGKNIIANTYFQKYAVKKIYSFEMHPGHGIEDEAKNFKLYAGPNVVTLPQEKGEIPAAICVPGFWAWPKEATNITEAYPEFSGWAKDYFNNKFAAWYKKAEESKVVRF
ncbi:MAG: LruC domain-containing protein [Candidatus Cryptobacteroides sp.]